MHKTCLTTLQLSWNATDHSLHQYVLAIICHTCRQAMQANGRFNISLLQVILTTFSAGPFHTKTNCALSPKLLLISSYAFFDYPYKIISAHNVIRSTLYLTTWNILSYEHTVFWYNSLKNIITFPLLLT